MSASDPRSKKPRRKRRLQTSWTVRVAEHVSRGLITAGGYGAIGAIVLICGFLLAVALPLFESPEVGRSVEAAVAEPQAPQHVFSDEYGVLAATLEHDWSLRVIGLESGRVLETLRPFEGGAEPTALSVSVDGRSLAFGFANGTIRTASLTFLTGFPTPDQVPEGLGEVAEGEVREFEGAVYQRTPEGELRRQALRFDLADAMELSNASPVTRISHLDDDGDQTFVIWTEGAGALLVRTESSMNLLTGETETTLDEEPLPYETKDGAPAPEQVLLTGTGAEVLILHADGAAERIDARDPSEAEIVETVDLAPEEGEEITATTFLLGRTTLVTGSNRGTIRAWFNAKRDDGATADGSSFVCAHTMQGPDSPVVQLTASPRSRLIAASFADGTVEVWHVTSDTRLMSLDASRVAPLYGASILPKEDHVLAVGQQGLLEWEVDFLHPEASFTSFFRPVWYETYPGPQHVWQSEGASDSFETKLGFIPLVYGTLKATFYSMLFGTPLALLAALFTSEFLDRKLRIPLKSAIEMMASLPSVVLGFLAGIVIAPIAQLVLPGILASLVTIPIALLLGAHLWQLLPQRLASAWGGWQRMLGMALMLPVGIAFGAVAGPWMERVFFAGSIELWLNGNAGSATGAWAFLLLPLCALLVVFFGGRGYAGFLRRRGGDWSRARTARVDLLKLLVGVAATVLAALALGWLLDISGADPRGSFVDTYDPHNALLVGFVMGFAIIPIIYTLAEDALSSVPDHLRLASLGAGATPWQTAIRVVLPTATSGLFSAVMIGLGRAVGETMIVLMATGNTPIMELNPFNGFRTLSANIAVELPEAVQNSTHYRALFLAALVLFTMTFVLNTFAETVRIRFRKRSSRL